MQVLNLKPKQSSKSQSQSHVIRVLEFHLICLANATLAAVEQLIFPLSLYETMNHYISICIEF